MIHVIIVYKIIYNAGIKPNGTSEEVCDPKCEPGQCCMNGTCLCFDSDSMKVMECKGFVAV